MGNLVRSARGWVLIDFDGTAPSSWVWDLAYAAQAMARPARGPLPLRPVQQAGCVGARWLAADMAPSTFRVPPDQILRSAMPVMALTTVDDLPRIQAAWPAFERLVGLRGRRMYARIDVLNRPPNRVPWGHLVKVLDSR